jgi:hypothetical protein
MSTTKNYRIYVGFAHGKDGDVNDTALDTLDALAGNAAFPNLPVPLAQVTTYQQAFASARTEARKGGSDRTRAKQLAKQTLANALVTNALYCQSMARQNLDTLLSSGYDVVSTNRTSAPLDTPSIIDLLNDISGQLTVRGQGVLNGRVYKVQFSKDNGVTWSDYANTFNGARRMTLTGLTSATSYQIRFAALGGSTGQSQWSNPVSKMVT